MGFGLSKPHSIQPGTINFKFYKLKGITIKINRQFNDRREVTRFSCQFQILGMFISRHEQRSQTDDLCGLQFQNSSPSSQSKPRFLGGGGGRGGIGLHERFTSFFQIEEIHLSRFWGCESDDAISKIRNTFLIVCSRRGAGSQRKMQQLGIFNQHTVPTEPGACLWPISALSFRERRGKLKSAAHRIAAGLPQTRKGLRNHHARFAGCPEGTNGCGFQFLRKCP